MDRVFLIVIIVSLFAGGLAGCLDTEAPEPTEDAAPYEVDENVPLVTIGEDPEGDAYDPSSHGVIGQARAACTVVGELTPTCRGAFRQVGTAVEPVGVSAAPPFMDLRAIRVGDNPDLFVIELEVESMPDDPLDLVPEDGDMVGYMICWQPDVQCAEFTVGNQAGDAQLRGLYDRVVEECNDWWWCVWGIKPEIEAGSPGVIRWEIPRTLFTMPAKGSVIEEMVVAVVKGDPSAVDGFHYNVGGTPVGGRVQLGNTHSVDQMKPDRYTLQSDAADVDPVMTSTTRWEAGPGGRMDDMDLTHMEYAESDTHLTVAFEIAELSTSPIDHSLDFTFAGPDWTVHYAMVRYEAGDVRSAAFHCLQDCDRIRYYDIDIEYTAGSPGWINLTYDRRDLGSPMRGGQITIAYADLYEVTPDVTQEIGPLTPHVHENSASIDGTGYTASFWYALDTAGQGAGEAGELRTDTVGDVDARPPFVDEATAARLDITYLEVRPRGPGMTEITIGIDDLSRMSVPSGYDALLYAAGIETADGRYIVALHRDADDRQEFFCTHDTAVFEASPRDPMEAGRTPIEGEVTSAGSGGHGAAPGAIRFHVPNGCIGHAEEDQVVVQRTEAATFLIQDLGVGRELDRADEALVPGPMVFGGLPPPPEEAPITTASFLEAPFGVPNFWDIGGIAFALIAAAGGAFLVTRRRHRLRIMLDRIERAEAIMDARARETVLNEIRVAARSDLTRGRLPESHYAIVERRVESLLAKARLESFGTTFGELPHRLVKQLEAVLADGVITKSELELVTQMVSDANIPAADKEKVLTRLAQWDLTDSLVRA